MSSILVEREHVDHVLIREAGVERDEEIVRVEAGEKEAVAARTRHAISRDGADVLSGINPSRRPPDSPDRVPRGGRLLSGIFGRPRQSSGNSRDAPDASP
jgi:hypothetical protein